MGKGGSGGGSAVASSPAPYVQATHSMLLTGYDHTSTLRTDVYDKTPSSYSAISALRDALDGIVDTSSPFYGATAEDPTAILDEIDAEVDILGVLVDNLEDDTDVNSLVTAQEQASEAMHFRGLNRLAGSFSDINAVNSSAFMVAMTLYEAEREAQLNNYRAQLVMQDRGQHIAAQQALINTLVECGKLRLVALTDQTQTDIEYTTRALSWRLEQFKYVANILGTPLGSVVDRDDNRPSKVGSALSGALTGSAIGYMMTEGITKGAFAGGVPGAVAVHPHHP